MKRFTALLLALCLLIPAAASALDFTRTLTVGSEGEDVLAAQERLVYYEYYGEIPNGKFDNKTLSAVKQFQRRNELVVDGKIGPKTWAALFSDTAVGKNDPDPSVTLSIGDSGENVKALQRALRDTFYYTGKIDGIFGTDVLRAVKNFQASAGLLVDGKAGPRTLDALYNRTARIFNGGIPLRDLSQGDRGWDVYVLQLKLEQMNYTIAYVTYGLFDEGTVKAVKNFERINGLEETGKVKATQRRYLWPSAVNDEEEEEHQYDGSLDDPYQERTLKQGMYGQDVASAQMRLKAGGYLFGKADGIFGPVTKEAVIRFQKDYNLKPDGIIGSQTWALLKTISLEGAEPGDDNGVGAYTGKLSRGSRGPQVKKLQQQLIQLGYLFEGTTTANSAPRPLGP